MSNSVHLLPGLRKVSVIIKQWEFKYKCLLHPSSIHFLISIQMLEAGTPELKSFKWVWLVADILASLFISLSFFLFLHHMEVRCVTNIYYRNVDLDSACWALPSCLTFWHYFQINVQHMYYVVYCNMQQYHPVMNTSHQTCKQCLSMCLWEALTNVKQRCLSL